MQGGGRVIADNREARDRARVWRASIALVAFAFVVLALGAVPHAQQALDCPGSPLCRRWSLPTDNASPTVSATHRVAALATGLLVIALAAYTAGRLRADRRQVSAAALAVALIGAQAAAVALARHAAWRDWALGAHFAATALLFALAIWMALGPWAAARAAAPPRAASPSPAYIALLRWTVAVVFVVLLSGAVASRDVTGPGCAGWPLCGDGVAQLRDGRVDDQLLHRASVVVAGALLVAVVAATVRGRRGDLTAVAPIGAVALVFGAQVVIGAATSWDTVSSARAALHFIAAAVAWGCLVAALVTQSALAAHTRADDGVAALPWRVAARDYFRVTKPAIIVLLLVTTLGAMLIAGDHWPSPGLVLATLLGGALASGGAGALNCYYDRDIDAVMARTRKRPIPTGHLTPTQVRRFGLALSALAVLELALLVNPLAAALALAGNLFYVGIYTRWLKRATPQNIVIGGAAGSFPPLVGWAAVTGRLDAGAFVLFAIIFIWTPPHFWSLALLKANDYRRAGIPMLPVTAGEAATRRQILLYSLLLVAVTLLMVPTGAVGAVYLIAALVLGGMFLSYAVRMWREGTNRLAWSLFKYSNYYLAGLLAVMVLDRALGL